MGQHQPIGFGLLSVNLPAPPHCIVNAAFSPRITDGNQYQWFANLKRLRFVLCNNFGDVATAKVLGTLTGDLVHQAGVGVNQRGFHLVGDFVSKYAMAVDYVAHFQTRSPYLVDAVGFRVGNVLVGIANNSLGVVEYPVALAFADIKGFAIARVNQAVNIPFEFRSYLW